MNRLLLRVFNFCYFQSLAVCGGMLGKVNIVVVVAAIDGLAGVTFEMHWCRKRLPAGAIFLILEM